MIATETVRAQLPGAVDSPTVARFLDDASGQEVRLPTAAKNSLGWTIGVTASSLSTADTMRIELEFATTGGPTTAERHLEVRLSPVASGHSPPQSSVRVALPLQIPQHTDRIRFARHVPKTSFGNLYRVELFEDGRPVPDGAANLGQPLVDPDHAIYLDEAEQNAWRPLWIESTADNAVRKKSLQLWSLLRHPKPFSIASTPQEWAQIGEGVPGRDPQNRFSTVTMENMPLDWRALRCFDAVMIHRTDWEEVQTSRSAVAVALRDWTHAGGVIIVRDASVPSSTGSPVKTGVVAEESLQAVDRTQLAMADQLEGYSQMDEQAFASASLYLGISTDDFKAWQEWLPEGADMIRKSLEQYPVSRANGSSGVRRRDDTAGMVIYLGPRIDDEPVQLLQWAAVYELMSWQRPRLTRNGAEPILGSQRFFQWVIPGVAQPPVYTFMGLLGVFVILVGPVAYRKTAKAGRSYLMFAIAPVLAMATTGAMLAYGVISDGFGTRVRSRQITWVDGATGDAFTRTRSTYFAGIRPADGLEFRPDAEITLYPDNQGRSWESRVGDHFESRGLVTATSQSVRMSRDFLPSRQQRQFVIHHPSNGWGRIRVQTDTAQSDPQNLAAAKHFEDGTPFSGPESILVSSETRAPVRELLICDSQKRYFFIEELAAGTSGQAHRISRETASTRMGEMYKRQWLVSSVMGSRQRSSRRSGAAQYDTTDLLTQQLSTLDSATKPNEGVFEFELQQRMQLQSDLPANSFLGLTGLTADAVAIPGAEVTDSIHYVFGSLP